MKKFSYSSSLAFAKKSQHQVETVLNKTHSLTHALISFSFLTVMVKALLLYMYNLLVWLQDIINSYLRYPKGKNCIEIRLITQIPTIQHQIISSLRSILFFALRIQWHNDDEDIIRGYTLKKKQALFYHKNISLWP